MAARRASLSFTSPDDGGRRASFTGISRPDVDDVDLFSDVDDDELHALGLIPDDDMDDAQAYTEACHEQGVTEMTSILGRLQHSAMSLRHALVGDHGLAAPRARFPRTSA